MVYFSPGEWTTKDRVVYEEHKVDEQVAASGSYSNFHQVPFSGRLPEVLGKKSNPSRSDTVGRYDGPTCEAS